MTESFPKHTTDTDYDSDTHIQQRFNKRKILLLLFTGLQRGIMHVPLLGMQDRGDLGTTWSCVIKEMYVNRSPDTLLKMQEEQ